MNKQYLEEKAQQYALGQYLSEVPEDITYEQVINILNNDLSPSYTEEDLPDDLQIWEPFEMEDPQTVAEYIENCKDSILELLMDVTKGVRQ